jgi:hypothetical protein
LQDFETSLTEEVDDNEIDLEEEGEQNNDDANMDKRRTVKLLVFEQVVSLHLRTAGASLQAVLTTTKL